jgi:hypothetical protein
MDKDDIPPYLDMNEMGELTIERRAVAGTTVLIAVTIFGLLLSGILKDVNLTNLFFNGMIPIIFIDLRIGRFVKSWAVPTLFWYRR